MKRRDFLVKSAYSAIALTFSACGRSQEMKHDMSGMESKGGMSGMGHMASEQLADLDALPKGQDLKALPLLVNQSTQADAFKATLRAAPMQVELIKGKPTTFWTYNQSAAPLLMELTEGMSVEIELVNDLPQPTTIHWHGLPVPPEEDGAPHDAVPPNGRRTYRFTLPEDCAGTYWFHPHPHKVTHEQVFRGLAGVIVVRPKNKAADPLSALPETHLVVTDLKLNADGSIAENNMMDDMNGREGQFLLVNGQYQPNVNLSGATRVRLWNATSARFLNLVKQNSTGQIDNIVQVGTDGGLLSKAQTSSKLLVGPAERVELLLSSAKDEKFSLIASSYNQGKMGMASPTPATTIVSVEQSAGEFKIPALRKIEALGAAVATQKVVLGEAMSMAGGVHSMLFLINNKQYDMNRIDFTSKKGQVEEWIVENNSDMDHPFHIHGGQYQLVRREGFDSNKTATTEYEPAWKDTVNIKARERIVLKMVQQYAGLRMVHCHILEHEDAGMMANLQVRG